MPGVSEKDIQVDLNEDVLVIRGEKKLEKKEEKENFHFIERSYGTFQRALQLPFPVDPGQVQATFNNGVLTITLAKSAPLERSHRIQVQAGDRADQSTISGQPAGVEKTPGGDERTTQE
jgi:HSP20 family protein